MSWTAHSETPFINAQKAVIDPSGWADQFRDGQKIRQEYEARQQQKALNELSKEGDFNTRLGKARAHKYAGALVPLIQQQEQDRLMAVQKYNQGEADIIKTFGETGKLGAETGKIGAETQNAALEGLVKKYDQISAGALTQNPQYFALMLGDFENNGLINPAQKGMIIDMIMKDPQQASAVMRGIAKGSIESFKATAPKVEYTNLGDRVGITSYDNQTGGVTGLGEYTVGQSPDNKATNATSMANNIYSNDTSRANNINSVEGQKYASDNTYQASVYGTDSRSKTASEQVAVDWYKAETGASVAQQNANTNETNAKTNKIKANKGASGQPVRELAANERAKLFEIQEQQNADKSVIQTLDKMMKLVDNSYSGVAASGRAKGMSNIGLGGKSADNTVLYDNLATSQALAQLKATFGAAPTEGERKILMDIQASANKTPMQKKQIIIQAFRAVQVRQQYREELANGIRTGQYMVPTAPKTTKPQNSKGASIIGGILGGK